MRVLDSRYPNIFSQLDSHVDPSNLLKLESHKSLMIKKIISSYLSIRLKHFCKEYNENVLDKKFKRVVYKSVHFQGQQFHVYKYILYFFLIYISLYKGFPIFVWGKKAWQRGKVQENQHDISKYYMDGSVRYCMIQRPYDF